MPLTSLTFDKTEEHATEKQLSGKVCLIAGASGAIGCAVSKRFHQEGAKLALTHLSQGPAHVHSIGSSPAEHTINFPLDIRNREQVDDAVKQVTDAFGRLDVLVNCTGVLGPIGPTANVSVNDWVEAVEINLLGSFYLTRAVLPQMLTRKSGKIIHFSGGGTAMPVLFSPPTVQARRHWSASSKASPMN